MTDDDRERMAPLAERGPRKSRTRLLLLACSQRKRATRVPVPVLELYDGPQYRALRNLFRIGAVPADVVVRIVSAKYGLLSPGDRIPTYDRRLDPARDHALVAKVQRALSALARRERLTDAFGVLGKDYQTTIPVSWLRDRPSLISLAQGPPGSRVRAMIDWIQKKPVGRQR